MSADNDLAGRKALLLRQAELERVKLALAVHDVRSIVAPRRDPTRATKYHSVALRAVGFAAPLLGLGGTARFVRGLSLGLTAVRIVRNWRRRRDNARS
jgi:hypothetical protein